MSRQLASSLPASPSFLARLPLRRLAAVAVCGMGLLAFAGCGGSGRPDLGRVHGRVTMDGNPLVHAGIAFQPLSKGRESFGCTDANGDYELKYKPDVYGVGVGENSVRITTQRTNDPKTETVPARYNTQTTLRFEVKGGDNVANFDLTSEK